MTDTASVGHCFDWHELHTPKSSRECSTSPKPCAAATESYPRLDCDCSDLLGEAARAAHQVMMVVVRRARAVQGLAVGGTQRVDSSVLREALERAVDGRQPHALPLTVQVFEICWALRKSVTRVSSSKTAWRCLVMRCMCVPNVWAAQLAAACSGCWLCVRAMRSYAPGECGR